MDITNNNSSPSNWEKIVESINLNGLAGSERILKILVRKQWLYFGDEQVQETDLPQILGFMSVLKEHYGDNFDCTLRASGSNDFEIQFKTLYPKVTITNSRGKEIVITDLMIVHPFGCHTFSRNLRVFYPQRIIGTRLSVAEVQFQSRYYHSHLPGIGANTNGAVAPFIVNSFCLGGDLLAVMFTEFEAEVNLKRTLVNLERYEAMLYAIDSFVRWESLEGVPHIRMETVSNKGALVSSFNRDLTKVFIEILKTKERVDLDFYVKDNKVFIDPTVKSHDFIRKIVLEEMDDKAKLNLLCVYDETRRNYYYREKTGHKPYTVLKYRSEEDYFTIFKGEKRKLKLIKDDSEKTKVLDEHCSINPHFLKDVFRELENRLQESQVLQSRYKSKGKVGNT